MSLLSLAVIHDQLKNSEGMAREANEALAFFLPNGFALESFQCLTLLGRLERDRGDTAEALKSFQRALDMAEKTNDPVLMAGSGSSW